MKNFSLMEIYDNKEIKYPVKIAVMEYPSKQAEKIKIKIDKVLGRYSYKIVDG